MSNVFNISDLLKIHQEEVIADPKVVEMDPMKSIEALLGNLERVCDDIHTSVRKFAEDSVGSVVRLSKRAGTEDYIRKQLVHLQILSMNKAKKLSTRQLADFIKKAYWRIEQAERRIVRNLDKIGQEYGYDERQATEAKALAEVDQGKVVNLPITQDIKFNMNTLSPYDRIYRNSVDNPQNGEAGTDFGD